jgi:hypothetical protein
MDLSIVTLNWNVAPLVGELLDSIVRETRGISYEILVADNASKDGIARVVEAFTKEHSEVALTFLKNDRNLGFAAGNNPAIRLSKGRYVVLLNPDARVKDGALQKMVAWMDAHPDVGVAGPRLLNPDGTPQPSVRRFPRLADQVLILLKLHRLARFLPPLRTYFADDFDYGREQDVDQVMGAAFFVRRRVFEDIGLLDESFFIWFEEVDFCKRAKEAGWRVAYVPSATVVHHGGESFAREFTLKKQRYFNASMRTYFRKHRGAWTSALLSLPIVIALGAASLVSLWKHLRKRR